VEIDVKRVDYLSLCIVFAIEGFVVLVVVEMDEDVGELL